MGTVQPFAVENAAVSEAASFARLSCPSDEAWDTAMSADTKTPFEHVNDVVAQLKEMRHYAKNNVETLTAQWLLFDGELKKLKRSGEIDNLMTRQSELHDALNQEIEELEKLAVTLQPPPEESP
ncbi:hypothetical protein [Dyella jiangningensis]|nr:hypothetical protein [Dyella jiangningensis]